MLLNGQILKKWAGPRVYTHLTNGEDVPHCLRIRRGDGTDKYAISYRFYEDEGKAEAALSKAQKRIPRSSTGIL